MTETTIYPKKNNHFTVSSTLMDIVGNCFLVLLLMGAVGYTVVLVSDLPKANIVIVKDNLSTEQHEKIQQLLGNQAESNVLEVDLQPYVEKSMTLDWVHHVNVKRDWSQGLLVDITPRQPIARFGSQKFIDAHGVVFTPTNDHLLKDPKWMRIQGDPKDTIAMMQQVKQTGDWFAPLGLRIREVIATPRMTWFYRFDNDLRILVDKENTSEKLYQLSQVLQHQLNQQLPNIQTIDLRYKSGMAITWRQPTQHLSTQTQTTQSLGQP